MSTVELRGRSIRIRGGWEKRKEIRVVCLGVGHVDGTPEVLSPYRIFDGVRRNETFPFPSDAVFLAADPQSLLALEVQVWESDARSRALSDRLESLISADLAQAPPIRLIKAGAPNFTRALSLLQRVVSAVGRILGANQDDLLASWTIPLREADFHISEPLDFALSTHKVQLELTARPA